MPRNAEVIRQWTILREIERAVAKGIPILPMRIEDCVPTQSLSYFLNAVHWLDAITPPLEARLKQLADTATALLNGTEGEAARGKDDRRPDRFRAAVRTLLARDVRPRVLLALSGLVVAALLAPANQRSDAFEPLAGLPSCRTPTEQCRCR